MLHDLRRRADLTVITQDDPAFPAEAGWVIHDADLALSWHHGIETVPTLLRVTGGADIERIEGWSRGDWERLGASTASATGWPTGVRGAAR